jgi:hypothetical protein
MLQFVILTCEQNAFGRQLFLRVVQFSLACHLSTNSQYSTVNATVVYIRPKQSATLSQRWSLEGASI